MRSLLPLRLPQYVPSKDVEDSIWLRVLVQALVIVGIIAVDIAAQTQNSLWAIPSSIVGASWSWYRRRDRNITLKFCIALGMLVALGAFFGRILGNLNDTRLVLADLLIQIQVFHSFDLPRRKDLGYSIVIGLILLGVAGTVSQTLAFAPILLVFLAIALPILVLDYRSRLGIRQPASSLKAKIPVTAKNLGLIFLVVLGLGLVIFAFLPRFPGYQLRTFPVSQSINYQGQFDGRSITNPGYVREGNGTGNGTGRGGTQRQPGQLDDTFYYGFNSTIDQNLRGFLKPKIVMRVRSQAEGFWRVLAFDRYTGKGWEISRNEQVQKITRSSWSYQMSVPLPISRGRTKEVVQTYTVVSDLPNLIPALADPKQLYFPTAEVAIDLEGGLRAPVGLVEDMTYTVVSEVPFRDRTSLQQAGNNYPQRIQDYYLQVPPAILSRVRDRTLEILDNYNQERVAKSTKPLTSAYEKTLYLAQYLKQRYSIPDNPFGLPPLADNEDLVETFLFKNQGGYPDHFSTTLTIMLRSIGIPARLVAGFSPGQFNPFTGLYVVRNTDAYAMSEVYFPKYGWFAFDPIPNHPLIPPSVEETQTFGVLRQFWAWIAGWLPTPVSGLLTNIFAWIFGAIALFLSLFTQGWAGIITGLTIATGMGFLSWLAWQQLQAWRYRHRLAKLPEMERLYQQMLAWTAQKGDRKPPYQTPLEYSQAAQLQQPPAIAQVIEEICKAYVSWRYGGKVPPLKHLQQKWQQVQKKR
ncbi:transglutaminase TgpA family protein [Aliterella atlantica]|uniref:Transglutaminase n=1 Tax=Aliterella atlantica CENA595 TaxID=1618023 RepID=A0A0D8ZV00_9CYAN|nr:transglutaminase [Aliterella atlantica CENA595]